MDITLHQEETADTQAGIIRMRATVEAALGETVEAEVEGEAER